MSKVRFTRASKKDKHTVTARVNDLFNAFLSNNNLEDETALLKRARLFSSLSKGDKLILNVNGVDTVFTVNRSDRSTVATNAFPRKLKLPNVGSAVQYNVKSISKVRSV